MDSTVQRERLHQVIQEGELDLHERPVAGVLALQLVDEAAQLGAAQLGEFSPSRVHRLAQERQGYEPGGHPEARAGAFEQQRALVLDLLAAGALPMQKTGES